METGSLPLARSTRVRSGKATVNPLGTAIEFFADGEGNSVVALVGMAQAGA